MPYCHCNCCEGSHGRCHQFRNRDQFNPLAFVFAILITLWIGNAVSQQPEILQPVTSDTPNVSQQPEILQPVTSDIPNVSQEF